MEKVEKTIKKYRALTSVMFILFFACFGATIALGVIQETEPFCWFGFIATIISGLLLALFKNLSTTATKKAFVNKALEECYPGSVYSIKDGFTRDFIKNTGIVSMGDSFKSSDFIKGEYKNVKFEFSDIEIMQSSGSNSSSRTLFFGQWYVYEFNKQVKGPIVIKNALFSGGKNASILSKKIELENEAFNKEFTVYGNDQQEAFYILTPQLMEALMELQKIVPHARIAFGFMDNKFHFALNSYVDLVPLKLFKKVNIEEEEKLVKESILRIGQIIDQLKLDNNLYNKK